MKWFNKVVFHNYANFKGRARRKEYWMFHLFYILFIVILGIFADFVDEAFAFLVIIFMLAMIMPVISVTARRLHDVGKSGWLQLITLIPLIGAIVLLVFVCKDSDPLENEYGTSPKLIASSTDAENL